MTGHFVTRLWVIWLKSGQGNNWTRDAGFLWDLVCSWLWSNLGDKKWEKPDV